MLEEDTVSVHPTAFGVASEKCIPLPVFYVLECLEDISMYIPECQYSERSGQFSKGWAGGYVDFSPL